MPRRRNRRGNVLWVGQLVSDSNYRTSAKWVGKATSRERIKTLLEEGLQAVCPGAYLDRPWQDGSRSLEGHYTGPNGQRGWLVGDTMSGNDAQTFPLDLTPWDVPDPTREFTVPSFAGSSNSFNNSNYGLGDYASRGVDPPSDWSGYAPSCGSTCRDCTRYRELYPELARERQT